jgi:hypothetical protein
VPYSPILNIIPVLESTLHLIERTEYPYKGHPSIETVRRALREAIEAIHELEPLQAATVQQSKHAN